MPVLSAIIVSPHSVALSPPFITQPLATMIDQAALKTVTAWLPVSAVARCLATPFASPLVLY